MSLKLLAILPLGFVKVLNADLVVALRVYHLLKRDQSIFLLGRERLYCRQVSWLRLWRLLFASPLQYS